MISFKKINNIEVKPVKVPKIDPKDIQGYDLFCRHLGNILILSKKNQGKTNVLKTILEHCTNKLSSVVIFSSTVNKDPVMLAIKKMLRKKGIPPICYTSIREDGMNHLKELLQQFRDEAAEREEEERTEAENKNKKPKKEMMNFYESDDDEEHERKPKKIAAECFIVFDDLSVDLRKPEIAELIKQSRHFLLRVIVSTQFIHDIKPDTLQQFDEILLFKNITEDKLQKLHSQLNLAIDYPLFHKLYTETTKDTGPPKDPKGKHNWLYIDKMTETFRRNFNEGIDIK